MITREEVKVVKRDTSVLCEVYVGDKLINGWKKGEENPAGCVFESIVTALKAIGYKVMSYQPSPENDLECILVREWMIVYIK